MKQQINCLHEENICYDFELVNAELNLCEKCFRKLAPQIIKQLNIID